MIPIVCIASYTVIAFGVGVVLRSLEINGVLFRHVGFREEGMWPPLIGVFWPMAIVFLLAFAIVAFGDWLARKLPVIRVEKRHD